MKKLSADWVFPVTSPPVQRGVLILDENDCILDLIDPALTDIELTDIQHNNGILCPGFVNTHCHIELSYLHGRIEKHRGLDHFIRKIEQLYKKEPPGETAQQEKALYEADSEMREGGIVAVGDIVSFLPSRFHREMKEKSSIYYHSFAEVFGSDQTAAQHQFRKGKDTLTELRSFSRNNHAAMAPHATYSLSAGLFSLVKTFIDEEGRPSCIHHLENTDEILFLKERTGPVMKRLIKFGIKNIDLPGPGERPLGILKDFLPAKAPFLLVHNTVATSEDILQATNYFKNFYWCFCPNANLYIEGRLPQFSLFNNEIHRITLGTDSLASNDSLSVLAEMRTIQESVCELSLEILIRWATKNGADFLGINRWAGSFEKGKRPGVNLIGGIDAENLMLGKESRVRALTRSHPF
ncbi:MAG: amidohydrolase family protein [Bacteroidetes bacterium]|nr:amidohydrolase family protein [Bacteroidota bacterium]